jgi:hypothetical protein
MAVGKVADIALSIFAIKLPILPLRWQHFPLHFVSQHKCGCLHNNFEVNDVKYFYEHFSMSMQTAHA